MDVRCAYSALRIALTYGGQLTFIVFLEILIGVQRTDIVDRRNRVRTVSTRDMPDSYDFVIIGGGSAGAVLANRLTENANWTVLLLEAGGDEPLISDVPALGQFLQKTELDWQFKTEPSSTYCLGMNNNQCNWPTGKSLGGSSMHNAMLYIRGNRRDFDRWRDLGNPGWGYDDVLPYFKKSEDMTIPELAKSPYHGTGGYLTIERSRNIFPLSRYIIDAGRDIGYDVVDVNGKSQVGFTRPQSTIRDGLRCSTAKAFLRSASHRKNLYVSTYSMAEKILINETTARAYGVQFRRDGEMYTVYAKAEVILSAGVIKSPQLLMLSGIGPKEHLEEVGIQVIYDSPGVGQNLQEHVAMGGLTFLVDLPWEKDESSDVDSRGSSALTFSEAKEFLIEKEGPLYDTPGGEAMAFVTTRFAASTPDYPDIELVLSASGDNAAGGFFSKRYLDLKDSFYESLYGNIPYNRTYSISAAVLRPKSKGYIELRDANPNHPPVIVPNYFNDPRDLDVLIEGAKIVYNMSKTPTMKKFNTRFNPNPIPQCVHLGFFFR